MFSHEEAMMPILRYLADGQVRKISEIREAMADHFALTEAERKEMLPSGYEPRFWNRVTWGLTFLNKAGYFDKPKRGYYALSADGKRVAGSGLSEITGGWLKENAPLFLDWCLECDRPKEEDSQDEAALPSDDDTPLERLATSAETLRAALASEILETIANCSPAFFERLVVELLVKMGYGGSFQDAAQSVGQTGDGGIDGIVKEDRLGLDAIYVQAKRYSGSVGAPAVRDFVGALSARQATKGVFITTGRFTPDARGFIHSLKTTRVVAVDGRLLADLMIEFNLGVTLEQTYEIKRIDSDFFEE